MKTFFNIWAGFQTIPKNSFQGSYLHDFIVFKLHFIIIFLKEKWEKLDSRLKENIYRLDNENHLKFLFWFPTFKCFDDFKTGKKPLHCKLWSQIIVKASSWVYWTIQTHEIRELDLFDNPNFHRNYVKVRFFRP